jgi:hypothetical protein
MYTSDLVKAVINAEHGWAVAGQFEDTFDGNESFKDQNHNALAYIQETITDLLESDLLSEDAQDELQEYADKLEAYMEGDNEEDDDEEAKQK